jgi:hypothetical protein
MDSDDELVGYDIEHHVRKILEGNGNPDAARNLIQGFCRQAKLLRFPSSPFHESLLELLVYAFEGYLSGDRPDIARSLGLKARGRPVDPIVRERNILMVVDVLTLEMSGENLTENSKRPGAFQVVAERYGIGPSEVRDQYYNKDILVEAMARICCERLSKDIPLNPAG